MDTLTVVIGALIGVRLVLLALPLLKRAPARTRPTVVAPPRAHVDPCLGEVLSLPPEPGAEDALYSRLLAGALSRERYRAEMAALAARDQREHPVEPPRG